MKKIISTPIKIIKKPLLWFKNASVKKKIIVIVLIIIAFFVLSSTLFSNKESGYVLEPVTRTTISQSVSETGNIDSGGAISVLSPSTGIVEDVYIENGQSVKAGALLFKVQSSATVQEQQAAYANYLAAVSSLDAAKANLNTLRAAMYGQWESFRNLATNDTYEKSDDTPDEQKREAAEFQIAQDSWLAAEAQFKNQETVVAQAGAQVSSSWLLYQATQNAEIKATADGTVENLSVAKGGGVSANDATLTIVPEGANQFVHVIINEIDVLKIQPGQKVEARIDAIRDEVFEGTVDRIDSVGSNTQGVVTYNSYIKLSEIDTRIKSGMTANVRIQTDTRENALSAPNNAIKLYQGGRAVQILENGEPKHIPIIIGIRGNERTEIISGIEEGTEIIIGARNEIVQRESSFGF